MWKNILSEPLLRSPNTLHFQLLLPDSCALPSSTLSPAEYSSQERPVCRTAIQHLKRKGIVIFGNPVSLSILEHDIPLVPKPLTKRVSNTSQNLKALVANQFLSLHDTALNSPLVARLLSFSSKPLSVRIITQSQYEHAIETVAGLFMEIGAPHAEQTKELMMVPNEDNYSVKDNQLSHVSTKKANHLFFTDV